MINVRSEMTAIQQRLENVSSTFTDHLKELHTEMISYNVSTAIDDSFAGTQTQFTLQ